MISVFYTPQMVAWVDSVSPSSGKPKEVVASWQAKFGERIRLVKPQPVSVDTLSLAHDRGFVEAVLSRRIDNGFGDRSAAVAAALPFTSGAMLDAAIHALEIRSVAVAPCSGFHHAGWQTAMAYCTFNGLMVTACALKRRGLVQRVGILDFDQHYGNGTQEIIDRLGIDWVTHYTAGQHWGFAHQADEFMREIPAIVRKMSGCDVLLYQAGADPHIEDPLGGWLSTGQLALRDRLVFETAKSLGVPLAWNLAGGYQRPLRRVLDIHDNTMAACLAIYDDTAAGMPDDNGIRVEHLAQE